MTEVLQIRPPSAQAYPQIRNPRYPSLDVWRGLACLMIVLSHAVFPVKVGDVNYQRLHHPLAAHVVSMLDQLWIGVPMFFVISGYCISATADSSRRKSHPTSHYFKRRVRRIFPPYWAALAAAVVLFCAAAQFRVMAADPSDHTRHLPTLASLNSWQWLGNVSLTETWRSHLGGGRENEYLTPSWTLCYEEQFYAVCGLLILFMPRRFFSGALGVSILTAAGFAMSIASPAVHVHGFFFDGGWLMFAAGVLVYYVLNYLDSRARVICAVSLVAGIVTAKLLSRTLVAHGIVEAMAADPYAWYAAFIFALAILLLRPLDKWICSTWMLWPIAICGRMCYSLYLIHFPLCKVVGSLLWYAGVRGFVPVLLITVPILTVISILSGWAFYLLVERHFLNPPATITQPRPRPQTVVEPQFSVAV
jgi:peptidoglycan/LPS O-acetylase OafA/YrhL